MSAQPLRQRQINPTVFSPNSNYKIELGRSVNEANRILPTFENLSAIYTGRLNAELAKSRTYRAERQRAANTKSVSERLVSIKSRSSLTWDRVAELLGTSTRALHLWRNGGNLSGENLLRLNALDETLAFIDPGSGLRMKALMAKVDETTGQSVHDMLKCGDFSAVKGLAGKGRGRSRALPLTSEESALFSPLSVPVLINQRRLDFYTT